MRTTSAAAWAGIPGCAAVEGAEWSGRAAFLAATGCLGLAVGMLVYLTDRGVWHAVLMPTFGAFGGSNMFGVFGRWLPSFVHTFSFALFTAAALPAHSAPRYGACVAWCVVNIAFEIGQHPLVSAPLAEAVQGSLGRTPLTRPLVNYFLLGTFDVGDIAAAILGALAAGAVLRVTHRFRRTRRAQ